MDDTQPTAETPVKETIAIESITEESIAGGSVEALTEIYNGMTAYRAILQAKMEIVAKTISHKQALVEAHADFAKLSPEKRAALHQVLMGSHIAKDGEEAAGGTSEAVPAQ